MSLKVIFLFLCIIFFKTSFATNNLNVLLVNPSIKNDPFWHQVEVLTKKAAKDLDINLNVIHGNGNRFIQLQALKNYFSTNKTPDYIMLVNYPGGAFNTFEFLSKYSVKIITLEQTISGEEKKAIGKPQGNFKNWLGEIFNDNKKASEILANALFTKARINGKPLVVAGIRGHFGSESAIRNSGLILAAEAFKADLKQIVYAQWSRDDAYKKTFRLLKRYPNISVIWCASDEMALGVINAIKRKGLIPGKDIFVGGFDWIEEGINSIKKNEMTASVGGHFMMGAWGLLAIYDKELGIDRLKKGSESTFKLELIESDNIAMYSTLLNHRSLMEIDFKQLSLFYSPTQTSSSFKLADILKVNTTDTTKITNTN